MPYDAQGTALNWTAESIVMASSDAPLGPFNVEVTRVSLKYPPAADFSLFVDDDGTGFVLYTSHATNIRVVVEKLNPLFTAGTGDTSQQLGPEEVESPVMFKYNATYFVLTGHLCCYCLSGSNAWVYTAQSPLGPFRLEGNVINEETSGIHAQLNYVFCFGTQCIVTMNRWASSPDGEMRHDFQYWSPVVFESNGQQLQNLTFLASFRIDAIKFLE